MTALLLLSGGLDSAAIAGVERPSAALFVDYGQLPALAERDSARMVAQHLSIELREIAIDLSALGTGLLVGHAKLEAAPTPEWFPFRNQFLVTIAAAVALRDGYVSVLLGVVAGDGDRHADGTPGFVDTLDTLVSGQEGKVRVTAPHIHTPPAHLIAHSGLPRHILRRTHSCHVGNLACGQCPGCHRRVAVLSALEG